MKQVYSILVIGCVLILSCLSKTKLTDIILTDLQENKIELKTLLNDSCTVVVFYSPECPLSENYTLTVNNLQEKYKNNSVKIIGVIPGNYYTKSEISTFLNKYRLNYTLLLDPKNELVKRLDAHITPECFAINSSQEIIYQGAIDNWAVDLGKKRSVVSENYLDDAIYAILANNEVSRAYVKPIGCHIE